MSNFKGSLHSLIRFSLKLDLYIHSRILSLFLLVSLCDHCFILFTRKTPSNIGLDIRNKLHDLIYEFLEKIKQRESHNLHLPFGVLNQLLFQRAWMQKKIKKLNKETKFEEIRRNNLSKLLKANPVMKQNASITNLGFFKEKDRFFSKKLQLWGLEIEMHQGSSNFHISHKDLAWYLPVMGVFWKKEVTKLGTCLKASPTKQKFDSTLNLLGFSEEVNMSYLRLRSCSEDLSKRIQNAKRPKVNEIEKKILQTSKNQVNPKISQ
ncbi:hypothetical protein EGR_08728 [Echinococcus granulosus]|uniref:Uncharacterized protein n=1 Tax=Echinococcus granulosus TaxID=6210 RepID=W6USJ6_ECHGR|nr:hypothetical protein EGR_08728 [Echinococcus granulosus]EUB56414.1 hypothetical protein EGR_08728 [Echinococcus granulosus]